MYDATRGRVRPRRTVENSSSETDGAPSENSKRIRHCANDLIRAQEEGRLQVETPRVHAPQDHFDRVQSGWSRKPVPDLSRPGRTRFSERSPPCVDLKLEWVEQDRDLIEDMLSHNKLEGPLIVYGDMHLWRMDLPQRSDLDWTMAVEDGRGAFNCEADFRWAEVEVAGWR